MSCLALQKCDKGFFLFYFNFLARGGRNSNDEEFVRFCPFAIVKLYLFDESNKTSM